MRRHFPNLLTLCNLFCGCCAVVLLLYGQPVPAAWFTLGSFVFDYADGMVARALGVSSPMGRELDSLADVVSFGFVPGAMLYGLLANVFCASAPGFFPWAPEPAGALSAAPSVCVVALPAFVLTLFAAYRLARFNLDTEHRGYFAGLSTPACTVFVLGLTLGAHANQFGIGSFLVAQPWVLFVVAVVFSYLMVSDIPMFGLKIKSLRWQDNRFPILFLALTLGALVVLKALGLSVVILIYIAISIFSKNAVIGTGSTPRC